MRQRVSRFVDRRVDRLRTKLAERAARLCSQCGGSENTRGSGADYVELIERYLVFHRGDTKQELAKVSFPRINLAFLDSVVSYDQVMAEFSSIHARQTTGDILSFDDYTPDVYPGVVKAADEICLRHGYTTKVVSANSRHRYLIAEKR